VPLLISPCNSWNIDVFFVLPAACFLWLLACNFSCFPVTYVRWQIVLFGVDLVFPLVLLGLFEEYVLDRACLLLCFCFVDSGVCTYSWFDINIYSSIIHRKINKSVVPFCVLKIYKSQMHIWIIFCFANLNWLEIVVFLDADLVAGQHMSVLFCAKKLNTHITFWVLTHAVSLLQSHVPPMMMHVQSMITHVTFWHIYVRVNQNNRK